MQPGSLIKHIIQKSRLNSCSYNSYIYTSSFKLAGLLHDVTQTHVAQKWHAGNPFSIHI